MAVVARALWAGCNLTDHYVARHFKGKSTFSIALGEEWISIPIMILLVAFCGMPDLPPMESLIWIAFGVLFGIGGFLPYIAALRKDEAYNIAPLFEMVPVFLMIMAFFLLGESMGPFQTVLGLACLICGFFFLWDLENGTFKTVTFLLMALSSLLYAAFQLNMRVLSADFSAYDLLILLFAGRTIGLTIFAFFVRGLLRDTLTGLRTSGRKVLLAITSTQMMNLLANFAIIMAFAKAPTAAHVAVLSAMQPVFAFMITHVLSFTAPGHYPRLKWNKDLKIKLILLALIIICSAGLRLT